ncbi:hypothetical protein PQG02_12080 [Nostoc sp. UHCC 0926]|uniref:hypothetical protein n=1 Tax=Nostoc sp. TaxID=1180 RepID=UPI0027A56346|nr:hypothetical protein PQG02_12080 [Nostoc sp. UHCC 0926]
MIISLLPTIKTFVRLLIHLLDYGELRLLIHSGGGNRLRRIKWSSAVSQTLTGGFPDLFALSVPAG